MNILSVFDKEFAPYGRVVTDVDTTGMLKALAETPVTDGVVYVACEPSLMASEGSELLGDTLFGGMPYQFGFCNGHNTKLNCLEYHRDSEFNLGCDDFILLLATMADIEDGVLDTAKVKAFRCPKGTLIEVYATSLHYAPCHADAEAGFRVLIALPEKTNTDYKPMKASADKADKLIWARNKWLLAHAESSEAAQGAVVALTGVNIDIAADI